MNDQCQQVLEYVNKHPYRSIAEIADALNMPVNDVETIVNGLHEERRVLVVRDHFVPQYGFVPYDSPLVEPE